MLLDYNDRKNLKGLSDQSIELLDYIIEKFKDLKVVDSLKVDDIRFYIETDPDKMESLIRFEPTIGYGVSNLNRWQFEKPIVPMNDFFELVIILMVGVRNDDASVGLVHLEKRLLIPKL